MDTQPTSGRTVARLPRATSTTVTHRPRTVRLGFCSTRLFWSVGAVFLSPDPETLVLGTHSSSVVAGVGRNATGDQESKTKGEEQRFLWLSQDPGYPCTLSLPGKMP